MIEIHSAARTTLKILENYETYEHYCYQEYVEMLFFYLAWCLPTLAALHSYRQLIGHQRLVDAQSFWPIGEVYSTSPWMDLFFFFCCCCCCGCWLLFVGCWLLVGGCWLLVVGCWLLVCWFVGLLVCWFVGLLVCGFVGLLLLLLWLWLWLWLLLLLLLVINTQHQACQSASQWVPCRPPTCRSKSIARHQGNWSRLEAWGASLGAMMLLETLNFDPGDDLVSLQLSLPEMIWPCLWCSNILV